MGKSDPGSIKLWGEEASSHFLRLPAEFLYHYRKLGLNEVDFVVLSWIDFFQWSQKPAFPHPAKLAHVMQIAESEAVKLLFDLRDRGYITLEATQNNSRNYHQDLRPTRVMLQKFLKENPNHCEVIKRKSDERIDTSTNRNSLLTDTSSSIDTSIPRSKKITSLAEEFKKYRKKS